MKLFGKHIFPRQVVVFASGLASILSTIPVLQILFVPLLLSCLTLFDSRSLLVFAATTYDVHRSIKNNEKPPSKEQIQSLQDYLESKRRQPPSHP